MKVGLCIPVCDPGEEFGRLTAAIEAQSARIDTVLIIDSSASESPIEWPSAQVLRIDSSRYDHGGTRRMAAELLAQADLLVFLTQDAVPADPEAIASLLAGFSDPRVGAAYGRQLPRPNAGAIESHARLFNYPDTSGCKSAEDIPRLGLKAPFLSNSFAAYRRTALEEVGSFPGRCIVSEDTHVAARMLLAGWKIAYRAEARVFHSHDFGLVEEFQRYFDIGVFHARAPRIRRRFGSAEGEGWRFLKSELQYLLNESPLFIPSSLVRTGLKFIGYRLGLREKCLPLNLKRRSSMQGAFWNSESEGLPCSENRPGFSQD